MFQSSGCRCIADLNPDTDVPAYTANKVLKFLPLPQAVLCKLSWVADLLLGWLEVLLLELLGLPQDLLCCDLHATQ